MIEVEEFERVYRTYRDLVFRHALRVAGRRDVAEEITGDAFVALFEHRADVTPAMLPGWLVTFVKRRGIDHWRHREVVQRHEATASEAVTIPAESTGCPRNPGCCGDNRTTGRRPDGLVFDRKSHTFFCQLGWPNTPPPSIRRSRDGCSTRDVGPCSRPPTSSTSDLGTPLTSR